MTTFQHVHPDAVRATDHEHDRDHQDCPECEWYGEVGRCVARDGSWYEWDCPRCGGTFGWIDEESTE